MDKVVAFGEIMLRLSPPGYSRFVQARSFDAIYGGGEANVAVSLANFGLESFFVTKVPDHEIGQCAINSLRSFGVKVDYIQRAGERLGIYFCENGSSQRPSKVIYDRTGSSISGVKPGEFDWQNILAGGKWFHVTGITPALSDSAALATLEAVKASKESGVVVSVDLNYRKKLWSKAKAREVMSSIMPYVDILIGNEEDAESIFGIKASGTLVNEGKLDRKGYVDVAKQLIEMFKFKKVAITLRESKSASDNGWAAMIYDGKNEHFSKHYDIHIVDRVGGGDAFAGGLIYSLIKGLPDSEAIEFAAAASCLKHSITGDFNAVSVEEVNSLMNGNASGRVQR